MVEYFIGDPDFYQWMGRVIEYYDQFLCIKSLIEKGGIGKVYFVETDYWYELGPEWTAWTWDPGPYTKKGGGAASLISGCHAIGAMMSIGGDVEEVFCNPAGSSSRFRQRYLQSRT